MVHRHRRLIIIILVATILGSGFAVQCIGAWQDSQTTDEGIHLSAGLSYWQTRDFRLNPEHPPLIKLLAAVPLVVGHLARIDTSSAAWQQGWEWMVGVQVLYPAGDTWLHARWLLWWGRLPMIVLWATLGWLIWWWARARWGDGAGLVGLTAYVADPNFLGHGHLITTDVGVTLGFLATIWWLDRFLGQPSWRRLGWLTLIFGLTQLAKFSAIILWLIVPLLGAIRLLYGQTLFSWRWWWRMLAGLVVATGLLMWLIYGLQLKRIDSDPLIGQLWQQRQQIIDTHTIGQQPKMLQYLIRWSDPTGATGKLLIKLSHATIPAYSYWRGFFSTSTHDLSGHPAILLGQESQYGWWYYFPVAVLVKTPIVTLLLVLVAAVIGLTNLWRPGRPWSKRFPFDAWLLGLPPLMFFGWAMTSHIDIGLRHIFPVYPFLFLAVASLVSWSGGRTGRTWRNVVVIALGLLPISTALAWPNTIGYFSEVVGGSRQGYRYLLDSNLDWGQDVWRLRLWLNQQHFSHVQLSLFGSIPLNDIFPEASAVPSDQAVEAGQRPHGIVIVSTGNLYTDRIYGSDGPFHWLRPDTPRWRIGSSINVYDFR